MFPLQCAHYPPLQPQWKLPSQSKCHLCVSRKSCTCVSQAFSMCLEGGWGGKAAELIQHRTHLNPLLLKTLFKHSTSPSPPSCCGTYSRKQFLLDLMLGGTRAARMASSNTFLRPRCGRQKGRGTEELLEGELLQLSAPSDIPS